MGKRGPAKKPAALKKAQGTFRPDRDTELPATPGLPTCPPFLADHAKELWPVLGKLLVERKVLSSSDQLAFALLCQAWADWREAVEGLKKTGLYVKTEQGTVYQHPLVGQRNRSWLNVMKGCQEFGLTAAARTGWGQESAGGSSDELTPAEQKMLGIIQ